MKGNSRSWSRWRSLQTAACLLALLTPGPALLRAQPAARPHWVASWACAPIGDGELRARRLATASAQPELLGAKDVTLRQIVHLSLGGSKVRVAFTNEFGKESLRIAGGSIGLSAGKDSVRSGSMKRLAFGGSATILVPAGATVVSDPVDLVAPALGDLAISLYLPAQSISQVSVHPVADQTNYMVDGDHTMDAALAEPATSSQWRFLRGVEVAALPGAGTIAAFGDSITDGAQASRDTNSRWPDELARRLHKEKGLGNLGVLNLGISGNRLLENFSGPNGLMRLGADVLEQPGVRSMILLEGINDIGLSLNSLPPRPGMPPRRPVTAEEIIQGYLQVIERAHEHGIQVLGATLLPYKGAFDWSEEGERVRVAVNQWIRTSRQFDGVIDFDAVVRDPADPSAMVPAFNCGDHLHPSDAGYLAMGKAIDLGLLRTGN